MTTLECREVGWSDRLPDCEWDLEREIVERASARGLRFALGGGLAFSTYACRWRNSKDMDLFILPEDRDAMVDVTREAGFVDLYDDNPYERHWIYRSTRDGIIVDLIWQMANRHASVDEGWLTRGREILVRGTPVRLVPPEELLYSKLFVLQRERCDWPDMLNILAHEVDRIDWDRLPALIGEADLCLFGGFLSLFRWLAPSRARLVPAWVWERTGLAADACRDAIDDEAGRASLLDSRDWFGANLAAG